MHTLDEFARSLTGDADGYVMTFRHTYATSVDDLWEAITDHDRVARWLGRLTPLQRDDHLVLDLKGAEVIIDVRQCDPPHRLVVGWTWLGQPTAGVSASLRPINDAETELILQHDTVAAGFVGGYGGGWECCLLDLGLSLGDRSLDASMISDHEPQAQQRWLELRDQLTS
jgi:uncharacterized protein YndB with AHSA1/START domain